MIKYRKLRTLLVIDKYCKTCEAIDRVFHIKSLKLPFSPPWIFREFGALINRCSIWTGPNNSSIRAIIFKLHDLYFLLQAPDR